MIAFTCWVMHFDPAAIREQFHIPDPIEPVALLEWGIRRRMPNRLTCIFNPARWTRWWWRIPSDPLFTFCFICDTFILLSVL